MLQGHPVRLNRNPDPLLGLAPEFCTIETLFGQVDLLLVVLLIVINLYVYRLRLKVCRDGQRLLAFLLLFFHAKAACQKRDDNGYQNDHHKGDKHCLHDLSCGLHVTVNVAMFERMPLPCGLIATQETS